LWVVSGHEAYNGIEKKHLPQIKDLIQKADTLKHQLTHAYAIAEEIDNGREANT
jgi:hypothetical protein